MGFALKLAGVPKTERLAKVQEAARILQLEPLLTRKPGALSGGQRQRVAIGRAIVRNPKVFLFDEPLSNLDAALRVQMRIELARLHRALDATMIYVTHDQVEAMTMADRIVVLKDGRIEQVGTPLDLYHHPANLFVAGFIGSPKMNFLPATVTAVSPHGVTVGLPGGGTVIVAVAGGGIDPGAAVTLGLRAEQLMPDDNGSLRGEVVVVEHLGGESLVYIQITGDTIVTVRDGGDTQARVGQAVALSIRDDAACLFDDKGRALAPLRRRELPSSPVH
jgi:multiple sugar transport system ATP-binding protein